MVDKNMTIRTQNHYHFYDHRYKNINNILYIINITNGVDKYVKVIKLKKSFKSPKTLYTITIIIDLKTNRYCIHYFILSDATSVCRNTRK